MKKRPYISRYRIHGNNVGYEGETIETKVARIVQNKEPITDGAPLVYTEKADGVRPEFNIRTDKWDVAQEAMDKVHASNIAASRTIATSTEEKPGSETVERDTQD